MRKIVAATALAFFCFGAMASETSNINEKHQPSTPLRPAVLLSSENTFKLHKVSDATGACHYQCGVTSCCAVTTEAACDQKANSSWSQGTTCADFQP